MNLAVENPAENPNFVPEKQGCGYTILILQCIVFLFLGIMWTISAISMSYFRFSSILAAIGSFLIALFDIFALRKPDYLGGNPSATKITPLVIGSVLISLSFFISTREILYSALTGLIFPVVAYFMYIRNDTDPSSICLFLKPWNYKPKLMGHPPYGYPPYGAPMPRAYPPYGAPVPQAYPQYGPPPPQAYAPQGYPPVHAPQGYPAHVPQGQIPQSYLPPQAQAQTHAPQGQPPQYQPPQNHIPQGYPPKV